MSGCRGGIGHVRHWFTFYGAPGHRSPFCQRGCGTPNPRALTGDEWRDLEQHRKAFSLLFRVPVQRLG